MTKMLYTRMWTSVDVAGAATWRGQIEDRRKEKGGSNAKWWPQMFKEVYGLMKSHAKTGLFKYILGKHRPLYFGRMS